MNDEELVEKIRTKDKELYGKLVERYEKKLLKYAQYLVGNLAYATDIVQEAFINAYINLNSFDTKKKFSSWIYRIVHNQAVNFLKKHKKQIPLIENMKILSNINIEEDYSKKEIVRIVNQCLKELPIIYSEPLVLYYLEGKSYEEISDILRIPSGTVAVRISRAKVIMKKICQKTK